MKAFHVYIMASKSRALYVGMTGNLRQRVYQHKTHRTSGFTARYHITRLVYLEAFRTPYGAIKREKQIKRWRREKKIKLIERLNPGWRDLAEEWSRAGL